MLHWLSWGVCLSGAIQLNPMNLANPARTSRQLPQPDPRLDLVELLQEALRALYIDAATFLDGEQPSMVQARAAYSSARSFLAGDDGAAAAHSGSDPAVVVVIPTDQGHGGTRATAPDRGLDAETGLTR